MNASKMLLLSPYPTSFLPLRPKPLAPRALKTFAMAKQTTEPSNSTTVIIAIASGLISTPIIGWSLYTLKTTGCGLPPGPGGSIGALEGVSYLVVVGIVAWSIYTKAKTGSGLPNGPFGLLGAVEGLSYLSLLAILVVFGLHFLEQGSIPGPLPSGLSFFYLLAATYEMDRGKTSSCFIGSSNNKIYMDPMDISISQGIILFLPSARFYFTLRSVYRDWKHQISSAFFAHNQLFCHQNVFRGDYHLLSLSTQ